jgi:hypothetical protein
MKREAWGVRDLTRNGIKKKRKKVRKSKKVDYYFLARSSFFGAMPLTVPCMNE